MNKGVKRIASLFLAVVMLFSTMVVTTSAATVANVGALLDEFKLADDNVTFTVTTSSRIYVVGASAPTGDLLQTTQLIQREMRAQFGEAYFKEMVWGPANKDENRTRTGDVVLVLNTASGTGADGYKLEVTADTATVTAADTDGLIYGANTLMKCFRAVGGNVISGFTAADTPDTKERTVHLDTARKYYTVEWICNFIRQMSWMGYNALQVHVSEDGGFRGDFWDEDYYQETDIDGDGYTYNPANDFSWLAGSHVQYWVHGSYANDPNAGDYLTTAELVQICEVAKEYHIEIIPSFDSPAHMDYITWKFEQNYKNNKSYKFTYNGITYNASDTKGCINYTGGINSSAPNSSYTTMELNDDSSDDTTIKRAQMSKAFVFALYEDMADFFKEYAGSKKFMIGADEVGLDNSTWQYNDFVRYVNELSAKLKAKEYTVRMFNDFIGSTLYNSTVYKGYGEAVYGADSEDGFDKDIEIVYWNSDFNPSNNSGTNTGWNDSTNNYTWHVKFFWENNTSGNEDWGDGGRTMYNAIQTYTYYVLRAANSTSSTRDARNPSNRNWTFYRSTEERIYNEWYPADISERGDFVENAADVPTDQLGGAYFLIWNDYAAVSTESQVWNGAPDVANSSVTYYLLDRMASNIIKMWNWDVNDTVAYNDFATVRDTFGNFPGFTSCSKAASLPAATVPTQAYLADHSALEAALADKIADNGTYTTASYDAYEAAYKAAEAVHDDHAATADQITKAIDALNVAKEGLVIKGNKETLQTAITNAENKLNTENVYTAESLAVLKTAVDAAKVVYEKDEPTEADVTSAIATINNAITGLEKIVSDALISVNDSNPNTSAAGTNFTLAYLKTLKRNAFPAADTDTAPFGVTVGWDAYKTAVDAAVDAIDKGTGINDAVTGLLDAENGIATAGINGIISVSKISATANGSYITLKVMTNSSTTCISAVVQEENYNNTDIIAQGKLQKLKDGSIVKVWLVKIPTTKDGTKLISSGYKIKGWVDKTINIVAE